MEKAEERSCGHYKVSNSFKIILNYGKKKNHLRQLKVEYTQRGQIQKILRRVSLDVSGWMQEWASVWEWTNVWSNNIKGVVYKKILQKGSDNIRKHKSIFYYFSRVVDRVLVLQPGVRPEPLRRESWVQDTGPPETSRPLVISIRESSPRDLHLTAKTQLHSTTSKLQRWTPHAKQLARQDSQPHPLAERLPKIIIRSQTPQNTPPDVVLPTRKTTSSLIYQNTGTSPLHQEAYKTHWTNLAHWGQTPKTTGTTNLQPEKRRPQTQ